MRLIGFAGQKRAGKDTAADAIVDWGWRRASFADPLRQALLAMDPIVGLDHRGEPLYLSRGFEEGLTWENMKGTVWGLESRRLLQRLGTDVGRRMIDDNLWVDLAAAEVRSRGEDSMSVFTDVRFANEADMIHRMGGLVIHILRPSTDVSDVSSLHPSEVIDFECDHVMVNDVCIDDFQDEVRSLVRSYMEEN